MRFALPSGTQLIEEFGAGSIFRVALVRHGGAECVCKRLRSRMLQEPVAWRALHREAHVLAQRLHPNVPHLVEHGEDNWGPFLLQSRAPGVALATLVDKFVARGRQLPEALLMCIAQRSFSLLAGLHTQSMLESLVHGDIAPDHLWVTPAGDVTLIDFGQARWRDMPPDLTGHERGTLPYTSPEVARNERPAGQPDDVFALAASLAFAALGTAPRQAPGAASLLLAVSERGLDTDAIAKVTPLNERLRTVLLAALQYQPGERLDDARAALAILG